MFKHDKALLREVRVERPNPQYAVLLQEQLGGANGELKAALQYINNQLKYGYIDLDINEKNELEIQKLENEKEIVVCPPIWYGVASYAVCAPKPDHVHVDEDTYAQYLYCILKSMIDGGIKKEVSTSCTPEKMICNICNTPRVAADHVYGSWNTVKEATATTDGQRERTCNICGNKQTEVIPATGSTADTTVTTTEPTPGTSESEVTTESTPGTTAPEATDPEVTTEPDVEDPGCGSAVSMGIALIAILGTALIMKKRD